MDDLQNTLSQISLTMKKAQTKLNIVASSTSIPKTSIGLLKKRPMPAPVQEVKRERVQMMSFRKSKPLASKSTEVEKEIKNKNHINVGVLARPHVIGSDLLLGGAGGGKVKGAKKASTGRSGKSGKKKGGRKRGKKGKKKKKKRCVDKRRKKPLKRTCDDMMGESAMLNLYFVAHSLPDALKIRKFTKKTGKKKGKKGRKKK